MRMGFLGLVSAATLGLLANGEATAQSSAAPAKRLLTPDEIVNIFSAPAAAPNEAAGAGEERVRSLRTRGNSNFATKPVDQVVAAAPPPKPATIDGNTITFEYNSAVLDSDGRKQLDSVVAAHEKMAKARSLAVASTERTRGGTQAQLPVVCETYTLAGHTDLVGSHEHNDKLSRDRAAAVERYLKEKGLSVKEFTWHGKRVPKVQTEAADERNRRVEVTCNRSQTAQKN